MAVVEWEADLRQHKCAQRAFKLPVPHVVAFAKSSGVCETLEGLVPFDEGDAIITGLVGEHWPISREYFLKTYKAISPAVQGRDGKYFKKKIIVMVLELQAPTSVKISNGAVLSGTPGDWLVQYEPGSFGIVEKDVFKRTYQLVE